MSSLMPDGMLQVRVFAAREYRRKDEAAGRWVRIEEDSEPPVDKQVNEWVMESRAQLKQISSPQVNIYQQKDDDVEKQLIYVSVSVMYVPAVEGAKDDEAAESHTPRDGPVGSVPGEAESGGATSGEIYERPKG